jgi:hypothetical protein
MNDLTSKQGKEMRKWIDKTDDLFNSSATSAICVVLVSETNDLLTEWEQYKTIPGTTYTYRYDSANTNTSTQDHIHVFYDGKQLFAINRDGTTHDGSKAQLSKKQIDFLKSKGFNVPQNGLLEWISLDPSKEYQSLKILLD